MKESEADVIRYYNNASNEEQFGNELDLTKAEERGHNAHNDRHYLGLVLSVSIAIQRILCSCDGDMELRQTICELLVCMSVLDRSHTPCDLFLQDMRATGEKQETVKTSKIFQSGDG
eukprot:IDg23786t1